MSAIAEPTLEDLLYRRLIDELTPAPERAEYHPDLSLLDFTRQAWRYVEPAIPLIEGFHVPAICEHLEAVSAGEVPRLIINIPPRFLKSTLCAVMWPAWEWTWAPHLRFLTASYAGGLATRDAVKTRRLIRTAWYQDRWGDRFQFAGDQNLKTRYENNRSGHRISLGVGGAVTGEGGDRLIVDDPHNVRQAESDQVRQDTIDWWATSMSSRINDPATGAMVIVQQRVHEEDLTGYLLKQGGWEHLCLPQEFEEAQRCVTGIGWADPRTAEGELLCPERFDEKAVTQAKRDLGPEAFAGQHQQTPVKRGGGVFPEEDWGWYRTDVPVGAPDGQPAVYDDLVAFYDTALKARQQNDFTAIAVWGLHGQTADLLWATHEHAEFPRLEALMGEVHDAWQPRGLTVHVVEDKNSGTSLIQTAQHPPPGGRRFPVKPYDPGKPDKVERAKAITGWHHSHAFRLPTTAAGEVERPEWLREWLAEHKLFPRGSHDDYVDTTSIMGHYWFVAPPDGQGAGMAGLATATAKSRWGGQPGEARPNDRLRTDGTDPDLDDWAGAM